MKNRTFNLSIGQRLAAGFGLFLLVVAMVVGLFYDWHLADAKLLDVSTLSRIAAELR